MDGIYDAVKMGEVISQYQFDAHKLIEPATYLASLALAYPALRFARRGSAIAIAGIVALEEVLADIDNEGLNRPPVSFRQTFSRAYKMFK